MFQAVSFFIISHRLRALKTQINWNDFCKEFKKRIILGTSNTWSTSQLSQWTSEPPYCILDCRISGCYCLVVWCMHNFIRWQVWFNIHVNLDIIALRFLTSPPATRELQWTVLVFWFFFWFSIQQGLEIRSLKVHGPHWYAVLNSIQTFLRFEDFGQKPCRYTNFD